MRLGINAAPLRLRLHRIRQPQTDSGRIRFFVVFVPLVRHFQRSRRLAAANERRCEWLTYGKGITMEQGAAGKGGAKGAPGDIDGALGEIEFRYECAQAALRETNRHIGIGGPPSQELASWEATRDLLDAVLMRYDDVANILSGERARVRVSHQRVDQVRLRENLAPLSRILSAWLMLEHGKLEATSETKAIWESILSRGEQIEAANLEMFTEFDNERRGLETAAARLRAAIDYLQEHGAKLPDD